MTQQVLRNYEVFREDPRDHALANDGVSNLDAPGQDSHRWAVLQRELQTFVCEGEYHHGLDRILASYVAGLAQDQQRAVWLSGFYGSGKSHLAKVLANLWMDARLPNGMTARHLVDVPEDIKLHLRELDAEATRHGTITWAASGLLQISTAASLSRGFLSVLFQAAGLPSTAYGPARFALWLDQEGLYDSVVATLSEHGADIGKELRTMHLSTSLAAAVLRERPELADSPAGLLASFKTQFEDRAGGALSDSEVLETTRDVLRFVSKRHGAVPDATGEYPVPLTVIVLDEVQQNISDSQEKAIGFQHLIERLSSQFDSRVMVVATGQEEMAGNPTLAKIQDRFSLHVDLKNQDIDTVVRRVVLQKREQTRPTVDQAMTRAEGEIDRQLSGTRIAPARADKARLTDSYPLLPARNRFWNAVLRAADRSGRTGQLRSQLRIVNEANRSVADRPLGHVIPADLLYDQKRGDLAAAGVLLKETQLVIEEMRQDVADPSSELKARLLGLIVLISLLDTTGPAAVGVQASELHLVDLLVDDLDADRPRLAREVPPALEALVASGHLLRAAGVYLIQTKEGQEWDQDFKARRALHQHNHHSLAQARDQIIRERFESLAPKAVMQGVARERRRLDYSFFTPDQPAIGGAVPIWVRSGWDLPEVEVDGLALSLGPESPTILVHLPQHEHTALHAALTDHVAASEVLSTRATPTTDEGRQARASMQEQHERALAEVDRLVDASLHSARVVKAGGGEEDSTDLPTRLRGAADATVARLFRRYEEADAAGWPTVLIRAKEGHEQPLTAIGFSGESVDHPVGKAIMVTVGESWGPAKTLRDRFSSPPFGWNDDVLKGSLCALIASDAVEARLNGSPLSASGLTGVSRYDQVEVRRQATTVSHGQKLTARKILGDFGITASTRDVLERVEDLLRQADLARHTVSGPAPLPAVSEPAAVRAVREAAGNGRIVALIQGHPEIGDHLQSLRRMAEVRPHREREFGLAQDLARAGAGSVDLGGVEKDLQAVVANRSLLDEHDPVGSALQLLAERLRDALLREREAFAVAFKETRAELERDAAVVALEPGHRARLLAEHGVSPGERPDLDSTEALSQELRRAPLASWPDRRDALVQRAARVREEAARLATPTAKTVRIESATIRSEAELDTYLAALTNHLHAELQQHGAIVI